MATQNINLLPPLVESGRFEELVQSGQTISATTSPFDNSLAIFLSPTNVSGFKPDSDQEEPIYFASYDVVPSSERRLVSSKSITPRRNLYSSYSSLQILKSFFQCSMVCLNLQRLANLRGTSIHIYGPTNI